MSLVTSLGQVVTYYLNSTITRPAIAVNLSPVNLHVFLDQSTDASLSGDSGETILDGNEVYRGNCTRLNVPYQASQGGYQ